MPDMGRILIIVGLGIAAVGLLMVLGLPLFRLPGDVVIKGDRGVLMIPIATCILLSIVVSVVLAIASRR